MIHFFCCTHSLFLFFFSLKRNYKVCHLTSIIVFSTFTSSPRQSIFELILYVIVFKAWEKPVCLVLVSKDDQYFLDHHPPLKFDPKPHKDQASNFPQGAKPGCILLYFTFIWARRELRVFLEVQVMLY